MALLGGRIQRSAPTVDLGIYGIDDASMQWLEDRLGSRKPKASLIDSLARSTLAADEQRFMSALIDAMRGGGRKVEVSINKGGAGEPGRAGFMQATLQPKTREDVLVGRVRRAVENVLWGQESQLDAFCQTAIDHASQARTLPAVLVLGGNRGHGKSEALAAMADGLFKGARDGKPKVHPVDLSTVTDASTAGMFEGDGLLSDKTLAALVDKSIVCFQGANDLLTRAPQFAQRLQTLLHTVRSDAGYRALVYAFDFDQLDEDGVIATMGKALGPIGTRIASAYASFDDLDAATMRRYCKARLPQLLSIRSLSQVTVDFDEHALALIGSALATPHLPLEELDARIYQLVLYHLEAANDGTNRCPQRVHMTAAATPADAAAIIESLSSSIPDIPRARRLLRVAEVIDEPELPVEKVSAPVEKTSAPIAEAPAAEPFAAAAEPPRVAPGYGDAKLAAARGLLLNAGVYGVTPDNAIEALTDIVDRLDSTDFKFSLFVDDKKQPYLAKRYREGPYAIGGLVALRAIELAEKPTEQQLATLEKLATTIFAALPKKNLAGQELNDPRRELPKLVRRAKRRLAGAQTVTAVQPPSRGDYELPIDAIVADVRKRASSYSVGSLFASRDANAVEHCKALLKHLDIGGSSGDLERMFLDAATHVFSVEPDTTIALLASLNAKAGYGHLDFLHRDIGPGPDHPGAITLALEAIGHTKHASEPQRRTMRQLARELIGAVSVEAGDTVVDGHNEYGGMLLSALGRVPGSTEIDEVFRSARSIASAEHATAVSRRMDALAKATARGDDPLTTVNDAVSLLATQSEALRPEYAIAIMAVIAEQMRYNDAPAYNDLRVAQGSLGISLPRGMYHRQALVALECARLAGRPTQAQRELIRALATHIFGQTRHDLVGGAKPAPVDYAKILSELLAKKEEQFERTAYSTSAELARRSATQDVTSLVQEVTAQAFSENSAPLFVGGKTECRLLAQHLTDRQQNADAQRIVELLRTVHRVEASTAIAILSTVNGGTVTAKSYVSNFLLTGHYTLSIIAALGALDATSNATTAELAVMRELTVKIIQEHAEVSGEDVSYLYDRMSLAFRRMKDTDESDAAVSLARRVRVGNHDVNENNALGRATDASATYDDCAKAIHELVAKSSRLEAQHAIAVMATLLENATTANSRHQYNRGEDIPLQSHARGVAIAMQAFDKAAFASDEELALMTTLMGLIIDARPTLEGAHRDYQERLQKLLAAKRPSAGGVAVEAGVS